MILQFIFVFKHEIVLIFDSFAFFADVSLLLVEEAHLDSQFFESVWQAIIDF